MEVAKDHMQWGHRVKLLHLDKYCNSFVQYNLHTKNTKERKKI